MSKVIITKIPKEFVDLVKVKIGNFGILDSKYSLNYQVLTVMFENVQEAENFLKTKKVNILDHDMPFVEEVIPVNKVFLYNIDKSLEDDDLLIYLESPRKNGGKVKSFERFLDYAEIVYEEKKVAEELLSFGQIVVHKYNMTISDIPPSVFKQEFRYEVQKPVVRESQKLKNGNEIVRNESEIFKNENERFQDEGATMTFRRDNSVNMTANENDEDDFSLISERSSPSPPIKCVGDDFNAIVEVKEKIRKVAEDNLKIVSYLGKVNRISDTCFKFTEYKDAKKFCSGLPTDGIVNICVPWPEYAKPKSLLVEVKEVLDMASLRIHFENKRYGGTKKGVENIVPRSPYIYVVTFKSAEVATSVLNESPFDFNQNIVRVKLLKPARNPQIGNLRSKVLSFIDVENYSGNEDIFISFIKRAANADVLDAKFCGKDCTLKATFNDVPDWKNMLEVLATEPVCGHMITMTTMG